MKMANYSIENGSIVIEVVVALVIFMSVVGISIPMFANQFTALTKLSQYSRVLFQSEALLEKTIALDSPQPDTTVTTLTPCLKKVTVTEIPISLTALYTSTSTMYAVGNDCGGYMSPQSISPPFTTTFSTDLAIAEANLESTTTLPTLVFSDFDFYAGKMYITASSSDGYALFIIDPFAPEPILGRLQLPPIHSIDVINSYAFVALSQASNQVQIIDIHDPTQPSLLATITLPGVGGSFPGGISIRYYADRLYIGTHRTAGNEFHIFDVSQRAHPHFLGSLELNHNINDIVVDGNYAYLGTSGNTSNIIIVDIRDPAHLKKVNSITFPGPEDTEKVFLLGSILYAGRLKGASANHPELIAVDVSVASTSSIIAAIPLSASVTGLRAIEGGLAVSTNNGIFSITLASTTPFLETPTLVISQPSIGLDYENNYLYTLASSTTISLTQ